jgi:hypothetical protein
MENSDKTDASQGAAPASEGELDWSLMPLARGSDDSVVMLAVQRIRRDPALLFTTAYLLVSVLGLWCSYWFFWGFDLPILEYLQASDFLVAGVRDPAYALVLALGTLLVLVISWPETMRLRNPAKVEQMRTRSAWWRMLFSRSALTSWDATGLRPLTAMTLSVVMCMAIGSAIYVMKRGEYIRQTGSGHVVSVQFNGESAPLPHTARLLGSSSAFVFLWWPQYQRAEAVPIATIKRLQVVADGRLKAAQGSHARPPAR